MDQFHERGVLRGDLGVPFWLPDPRPGYEGNPLVLAGMGPAGEFGIPELKTARERTCLVARSTGKKHLASVLIGASKKNLSFADAIHAWLVELNRAPGCIQRRRPAASDSHVCDQAVNHESGFE